jgi:3-carboxy-cis,cis-muconate cycloisomerase
MDLLDPLFGSTEVDSIFSDRARLQGMLDFEAALAKAQARTGVIPESAAAPIAAKCRADLFDLSALAQDAAQAGNLAIPMVKQLTALVGKDDAQAMRYVHWGATSQDAIDTGLILQLRAALQLLRADLGRLCDVLENLAQTHRSTPVAARTWMQHAVPTVFGLKAASALDALTRHKNRLRDMRRRALVVQFGGAAGTLAALGTRGLDVAKALSEELRLELPALPWHAHRDRVAEVATVLALLTGTLGKIARDLSLQMQTEVGEVFERSDEGRGGSSTMPHKRNPVTSAAILAAAERVPALTAIMLSAMSQEHERGLGGWQAEWQTLPEIVRLCAGALHHTANTMAGLEVDPKRMRANLELTKGLIFTEAVAAALAKHIGKAAAHKALESASHRTMAENRHLRDVLAAEPEVTRYVSSAELDQLFDPLGYTGVSGQLIDRVIAATRSDSEEGE